MVRKVHSGKLVDLMFIHIRKQREKEREQEVVQGYKPSRPTSVIKFLQQDCIS